MTDEFMVDKEEFAKKCISLGLQLCIVVFCSDIELYKGKFWYKENAEYNNHLSQCNGIFNRIDHVIAHLNKRQLSEYSLEILKAFQFKVQGMKKIPYTALNLTTEQE
eukprot:CAMPEP_0202959962 /NCGR_PEP_ID=MMETSP1396-20130829/4155_1 /ASSEMBLY_ACC=CAM_ASM_000872 /TAXON_ID= /ORGANISM="Pseudokeronopsis sp., Strain Brazil" /LENGTH=106 /DNA_ID=CAMNT_0049678885 /DNA_START=333 /DNA_END=653 /DNA_ORIENTATION=-